MRKGYERTIIRLALHGFHFTRLLGLGICTLVGFAFIMRVDAKPVAPEQQALLSNSANIAAISALDAPANGSFSFIVIGDNRGGDKVFLRLIAQVNEYVAQHQGAERPLFALHTGDAVPSGKRVEWEHYARMRAALDIPMVQVRGNHEIKTAEGPKNYVGLVGPLNWVFDFSGCRFIGLDNATMRFSEASVEFLRRQLGAGQAGHVFVAFHEPPNTGRWAVHSMVSDGAGGRGGEVLAALKQGGVSAAFLGHIHLYDELELGGVQYIISGGGGAPLYTKYGFGKPEYGFLAVHVAPKQVSWDWVAHAK